MIQNQQVETILAGTPGDQPVVKAKQVQDINWVQRLFRNRKAAFGITLIVFFIVVAILAPVIAPGDPMEFVTRPRQAPTAQYPFGTSGTGQSIFSQVVWGTRITLGIAFTVGILVTLIGIAVGMSAGYIGGWVDEVLSLLTNIVLIIPSLPLMVVLAAFMRPGPLTMIFVLVVTGWAWPARVLRSQTLSLREKDFVFASVVSGESKARIVFTEILPHMTSLAVSSMIGSTVYAIAASVSLEFLGLGNVSRASWGTVLFWSQNNSAMLTGAWWTFLPVGICMAIAAFALTLINYGIDEITNPRLRALSEVPHAVKKFFSRNRCTTPVLK